MKTITTLSVYLLLIFYTEMVPGQNLLEEKKLPKAGLREYATQETSDTLEIEFTIQPGTTIDSSVSLGSCMLASSYDENIDFPELINYQNNQVIVGNFGSVHVDYTISVSFSAVPGIYKANVIYTIYAVSNPCRTRMLLFTINVIPPKIPDANFKGSPTSIIEGGTVHFTDLSINSKNAWNWDFGDGATSTEVNPTHSYSNSGNYSVSLTVTGPAGNDTETKENYIHVLPGGTPGAESWNFTTQWGVMSSPAIDQDGTIYIGSYENYLYAINPDGTEKWRHLAGEPVTAATIGKDGNIYIASKYSLNAIDKDGNRLWNYDVFAEINDLALGLDDIVYIITSSNDKTLRAISKNGELIWSLGIDWLSSNSMRVSIAPDGTIYTIGPSEDYSKSILYAVNPNGLIKWTKEIGSIFNNRIAIGSDGTVYIGDTWSHFYAINPDGTEKWTYDGQNDLGIPTGRQYMFEPTIGLDGSIYTVVEGAGFKYYIFSLSPKGKLNWAYEVNDQNYPSNKILSSVTVGADEMLYFPVNDSNLYALHPDGTLAWKFSFNDFEDMMIGYELTPTINENKTLFVGYGKKLFAVNTSSGGLAKSAWPRSAQNSLNTGRKINPSPYLVSPRNDSIHAPVNITLEWSKIAGSTSFEIEIDTTEDFSGSFVYRSQLSDTSVLIENLQISTTYYWHVRTNSIEGISDWSPIWRFTTIPEIPPAPILISPENEAVKQLTDILLSWNMAENAEMYNLEVSQSDSFDTILFSQSQLAANEYYIQNLSGNTTYYWRINAANFSGISDWSDTWHFTTIMDKPLAPVLISPANEAVNQQTDLLLTWSIAEGATTYNLEISESSGFDLVLISQSELISNEYHILGLNENNTYYWRVNAANDGGTSNWSDIWSFTTTQITGIGNQNPPQIKIYPMPIKDFLYIDGIENDLTNITIFSSDGILLKEINIQGIKALNIGDLHSGSYILRITNSKFCMVKKIVIQ
jgi:PKD repeat protein